MTEGELLADLLEHLRPIISAIDVGVVYKHSDITSGIPDVSTSFNGKTSWWEFKLAEGPKIKHANDLQHLNMRRLAVASTSWYVIWEEIGLKKRTLLCEPRHVGANGYYAAYESVDGWDHKPIIDWIRRVHGIPL